MKNEKRYITIPEKVATDKRLSANAKLIFGEIAELQKIQANGYCWHSNRYFGDHFGISTNTVDRCIKQLEEYGYISRQTHNRTDRTLVVKDNFEKE